MSYPSGLSEPSAEWNLPRIKPAENEKGDEEQGLYYYVHQNPWTLDSSVVKGDLDKMQLSLCPPCVIILSPCPRSARDPWDGLGPHFLGERHLQRVCWVVEGAHLNEKKRL